MKPPFPRHAATIVLVTGLALPFAGASAVLAQGTDPPFRWVSVGDSRGLVPYMNERGQGSGLAAADYDGDGDIDVYVPEGAGRPDRMYVNEGGRFEERAAALGLLRLEQSRMAIWFDYDNDRDLDLLVINDDDLAASSFTLYRQEDDHTFTDVTARAGLVKPPQFDRVPFDWGGAAAGDLDNDGWLDLYACQWGGPAHLFMNNRDGTFRDASETSGVNWQWRTRWTPVMFDFNGDGWQDIYVANDLIDNELWINQKDGTFLNRALEAGIDNASYDMGLAFGDYDGDGDFDIYISNVFFNLLYRNDSRGDTLRFTDVARPMGVEGFMFGWGTSFFDADRDGHLDLAVTNGYHFPEWAADTSRFYWNAGGGTEPFRDVSRLTGFNDTYWGSGLVAFDYDRDGDLDLMQTCLESIRTTARLFLFENQLQPPATANHWLTVVPRIDGPNHHAIGAVVKVEAAGRTQMRLITAGTSYLSQEPAEAFFGLGAETRASVRVEWPGGGVTELEDVDVDRVVTVTRPAAPPPAPERFAVLGVRPNPTRGALALTFALPTSSDPVVVELYDAVGRRVWRWSPGTLAAGQHTLPLPAGRLRPGVYHVRLSTGSLTASTRVSVVP